MNEWKQRAKRKTRKCNAPNHRFSIFRCIHWCSMVNVSVAVVDVLPRGIFYYLHIFSIFFPFSAQNSIYCFELYSRSEIRMIFNISIVFETFNICAIFDQKLTNIPLVFYFSKIVFSTKISTVS